MAEIAVAHPARSTPAQSRQFSKTSTPKLRDSCTGCANSKVKCSKDKPTCSRCTRRGIKCEYAASQRTGRTSYNAPTNSNGTHSQQSVGPQQRPPTSLRNPSNSSASSQHNVHRMQPLENSAPLTISPGQTSNTADTTLSLPPSGAEVDDLFASFTTLPLQDIHLTDGQQHHLQQHPSPPRPPTHRGSSSSSATDFGSFDIFSMSGHPSDSGTDQTDQTQDFMSSDIFGFGYSGPSTDCSNCCLSKALEFLRRLFPNASTTCTLPGSNEAGCKLPTIDSVISENKEMIDSISVMLDCPCSLDEYVATIICLVVFKMIAWYAAAAREMPVMDDMMDWNGNGGSNPEVSRSHSEEVLQFPTVVGSYRLDGHNQNRMAATLVLSELHRVQRLVRTLSKRLDSVKARNRASRGSVSSESSSGDDLPSRKPSVGDMSPLSASTLDLLEADLRKRLRLVSLENIEAIRG